MRSFGSLALFVFLSFAGAAQAASQQDRDDCDKASGDKAIAACTRVVQDQGESAKARATAYFSRGVRYQHNGDNDRAIATFNEVIRLDPKDALAYFYRGNARYASKDNDRAIADYTESIRLNPKYAWAYNNRGHTYFVKKDYDRALTDFNDAIRLDPKEMRAYYNRGRFYGTRGDNDRAIADFRKAVELGHEHALEELRKLGAKP